MSRRDDIIEDLVHTVSRMSADSGHTYTLKNVYDYEPQDDPERPWAMVIEGREQVEDAVFPKSHRTLDVGVAVAVSVATTLRDGPAKAGRLIIADIERIVLGDPTRGGNAVDTTETENEHWVGGDAVNAEVVFRIIYGTVRDDPGAAI